MNKTYEVISKVENVRLDYFISNEFDNISRTFVKELIEKNNIKVNGKKVKASYKVKKNDNIFVEIPEPEVIDVLPENIELDIIYEDNDIIVINKNKNMVVHPSPGHSKGTLVNALLFHCKDNLSQINGKIRPGIVHRIDMNTTGLLVVAKNNKAHVFLAEKLKEHKIKREYEALVHGIIKENKGKINMPIGRHQVDRKKMAVNYKNGKEAITKFTVIERFKNHTHLKLNLETGRTHQIRVHMSSIGYPILGDVTYGKKREGISTIGQVLHAKNLILEHPTTNKIMGFETELPEYFLKLISELRCDIN
jgi:23S rRNA pseudouridine1911/1915/1917 synthase